MSLNRGSNISLIYCLQAGTNLNGLPTFEGEIYMCSGHVFGVFVRLFVSFKSSVADV